MGSITRWCDIRRAGRPIRMGRGPEGLAQKGDFRALIRAEWKGSPTPRPYNKGLCRTLSVHFGQIFMSKPRCFATVKMSLSPRPHMFITMIWSFGKVGAIFITWAKAWLGSSAGMIPSSLQDS